MRIPRRITGPRRASWAQRKGLVPASVSVLAVAIAACGGQADDADYSRDMAGAAPSSSQVNEQESLGGAAASLNTQAAQQSADGAASGSSQTTFASTPMTAGSATVSEPFISAPANAEEEKLPSILTLTVAASEIVGDGGICQVWLDVPDSELIFGDISATFGDQQWPAVSECTDETVGWLLTSNSEGTWLVPCPAACALLAENPDGELHVEAEYWTEPGLIAR